MNAPWWVTLLGIALTALAGYAGIIRKQRGEDRQASDQAKASTVATYAEGYDELTHHLREVLASCEQRCHEVQDRAERRVREIETRLHEEQEAARDLRGKVVVLSAKNEALSAELRRKET